MENVTRAYYAVIPASVRYDTTLPAAAKLLYGEITALCNSCGYCWASNAYFSTLYGASERTVRRWISALAKAGYISVSVEYKPDAKEVARRYLTITDAGAVPPVADKIVRGGGQNCPEGADKIVRDNNTYTNITNNNDIEKTPAIDYAAIVEDYNRTCENLPKVTVLSEARKREIRGRLRSVTPDQLHRAFEMANASAFLTGRVQTNGRAFRASFDWILKDANLAKVLDGNYTDRPQGGQAVPAEFYAAGDTLPF